MRNHWKNKKKLKKWKKEMKRKKDLKISSPKIIERVDRFGKESRFVNRLGSVPSTETEMFGCEIVRDLPEYVHKFIKQIGHDVVIKVPFSNPESLTGSGENGQCHTNSKVMSILNGGNRLLGYTIQIMKKQKKICFLYGHSVWNTPEGKTRCVTISNQTLDFRDKLVMGDCVLFVPVGVNEIDKDNEFWLDEFIIYEGDDSSCLKHQTSNIPEVLNNQSRYVTMRTELKKRFDNKGYVFSKYDHKKRRPFLEELMKFPFSKESLSTGKSWEYYKNKILKTYFPSKKLSFSV